MSMKSLVTLVVLFLCGRLLIEALNIDSGWSYLIGFNICILYIWLRWRINPNEL